MENCQLVLLGDSLLMDAIEANLARRDSLQLLRVRTIGPSPVQHLDGLSPDLIIFDFDAIHFEYLLPLLRNRPGLPLLGLDINCNKIIALSSQQYPALSSDDLTQIIHRQAGPLRPVNGNGYKRTRVSSYWANHANKRRSMGKGGRG
jgi:hypothetical protein